MDLIEILDRVELLLKSRSQDGYEILAGASRNLVIEVKNQKVDTFRCSAPIGVSIRVMKGEGLGFSYSTSMDEADLTRMIDNALVGAQTQTPDRFNGLPSPEPIPHIEGLVDEGIAAVSEEEKIARAMRLEQLTREADPRIKLTRKSTYGESDSFVAIRNSLGVMGGWRSTSVSSTIAVIAEENGDSQMGWDFGFSNSFNGVSIEEVAKAAAGKAVGLLGAKTIPSMRCPVVLNNYVAGEFLEVMSTAFMADNVQKGKSLLAGKLGKRLFSPLLRIRDDGTLAGGMATSPMDGEGVASRNNILVEEGTLLKFLYDSYSARKDGCKSTGNAARGGIKSLPMLGATNFFVENGAASAGDMIKGIDRGVLVTDVIGIHTANPISGDFSVGASGFLIVNGRLDIPVKGIAVAGNILELFNSVEAVGNDLRFYGSVAAPSLLIGALDISGT